jgi:hypothetical protein
VLDVFGRGHLDAHVGRRLEAAGFVQEILIAGYARRVALDVEVV